MMKNPSPQEIKIRPARHVPLEKFEASDRPFTPSIVPGENPSGLDRLWILAPCFDKRASRRNARMESAVKPLILFLASTILEYLRTVLEQPIETLRLGMGLIDLSERSAFFIREIHGATQYQSYRSLWHQFDGGCCLTDVPSLAFHPAQTRQKPFTRHARKPPVRGRGRRHSASQGSNACAERLQREPECRGKRGVLRVWERSLPEQSK